MKKWIIWEETENPNKTTLPLATSEIEKLVTQQMDSTHQHTRVTITKTRCFLKEHLRIYPKYKAH